MPATIKHSHSNSLQSLTQTHFNSLKAILFICLFVVGAGVVTSTKGGYHFGTHCLFVCLSVRYITQEVMNGF